MLLKFKNKKYSSLPVKGTKCIIKYIKTNEAITTGVVTDYFKKNAIVLEFILKENLPIKDKERTYTYYPYYKGLNEIIFHFDGERYTTKDKVLYLSF